MIGRRASIAHGIMKIASNSRETQTRRAYATFGSRLEGSDDALPRTGILTALTKRTG